MALNIEENARILDKKTWPDENSHPFGFSADAKSHAKHRKNCCKEAFCTLTAQK